MNTEKKLGFGGQWIDGTPIGRHKDSDGDFVDVDVAFLEAVVRNFEKTKAVHNVPLVPMVIDHPESNGPAFGWVEELRVNDGRLERKFADVNPQFEDAVKVKAFRKRSDAFYLNPKDAPLGLVPALRHVGFLGAKIPAIKGIADIQFSADEGKTVSAEVDTAISFSEGDQMKDEDVQKTIRESVASFFKDLFKGDAAKPATASFSEADARKLIEGAVKKVETTFTEKITALETENKALRTVVDSQVGHSQRASIVAFCETLPGTILPAMKKMGIVEFMEALDEIPEKKKITVITFAEEGGKEIEKKVEISPLTFFQNFLKALPPFVTFGEKFGDVKLTGDGSDVMNPGQVKNMLSAMGVQEDKK